MGLFDSLFGGGNKTQQTTQQNNYDPWISGAQKDIFGISAIQNAGDINRSSQYSHAGFNPDQQKGFDSVRGMLNQWGPGTNNSAGAQGMIGQIGSYLGQGTNAQAARLGGTDYQEFMNPYLQTVLQPATDELQRQTENARAGLGARAAAAGSFGGSRGALQEAQLDRSLQETGSRLVADTMARGYDTASGLAEGNTNRQQQTNLQNANNSMQGANTMISGAGMLDSLMNSDFSRNRNVINDLLGTGAFQQSDMQSQLEDPLEALARLYGFVPQVYDATQTSTQPDNSPGFLQQLLGAGLAIGGMGTTGGGSVLGDWLVGSQAL